MDFLHNNYMQGYGEGSTWNVEINPPSRPVKSYYEECCIAAEMWWDKKIGDMHIMLSGGLDSEFVFATFLSLKMKITPVIMNLWSKDGKNYNEHDTQYAYKFCQSRNIKPLVFNLNFDEFVESGQLLEIAEPIKTCSVSLPPSMWLASQLDGTVLTGNDPPHLRLDKNTNLWYLDEEELIHTQFRYWKNKGVYGTPFFLSYTPEQMLSFLLDPTMQKLANHGFPGKLGSNSTKVHVFSNNEHFSLEPRKKKTGYEVIFESDIMKHPDCQKINSWMPEHWGVSDHQYHDVVEKLSNGITSIGKNLNYNPSLDV